MTHFIFTKGTGINRSIKPI